MDREMVLQGLFWHLARAGLQLSVRDLNDALKALKSGYGIKTGGSARCRDDLLWLAETLWARTDDEVRQLRALFRRFPFPTDTEVERLTRNDGGSAETDHTGPSATSERADDKEAADEEVGPLPPVGIGSRSQAGIPLAKAQVRFQDDEPFILTPHPPVSLRALTIVWRRFRSAMRTGPKVELDLEATIKMQCRRGLLEQPVLVPARRNQARLIVLIDVSNSMIPWRSFNNLLLESLRGGQLGEWRAYFFHNVPEESFYRGETLNDPIDIDAAMKLHLGSTLLILSDAGSARSFNKRGRFEETSAFISKVWKLWQPIAWINPMPRQRWLGTPAEAISRLPNVNMFELSREGMLNAVDTLRGQ